MTTNTDNLAELIRKKHQVLVQLRDIGQRQVNNIDCGEITQLLKLLATKQQLITALQAVEHELAPHRADDPDHRQWSSPEARARCAEQADQCDALLNDIVHLEKKSEKQMAARRNMIAAQLQQFCAAAEAGRAYAAQESAQDCRPSAVAANHRTLQLLRQKEKTPANRDQIDLVSGT